LRGATIGGGHDAASWEGDADASEARSGVIARGALAAPGVASADAITDWNKNMFDALPVARIAATGHADPARGVVERVLQVRPRVRGPPNDETDVIAQVL
jgi:hypothetical protein